MIDSLMAKIPFEICYSTEVVLRSGIFSPYDPNLSNINNYLLKKEKEIKDMYKDIIAPALSYTISRIKSSKWIDENGCQIFDKFHYFQRSLNSNIDRVTKNIVNTNWIDIDVANNNDDLGSSYIVNEIDDDVVSSDVTNENDDELPF